VNIYIALFRGINVGGHNKLPMEELVKTLAELGFRKVETYIQSGNVVFESEETNRSVLVDKIRNIIERRHGFVVDVIMLRADEFDEALAANPYPEAEGEPKTLNLYFMKSAPQKPNLKRLEEIQSENESYTLLGKVFYLHAPDGIGRSKLAAGIEKALGVSATARNWRTVIKIKAMADR